MKKVLILCGIACCISTYVDAKPVTAEDAAVTPITGVIHVTDDTIGNGGSVESAGIAILANGNILVGWEDDPNGIGAGWLIYDPEGNLVTDSVQSYMTPDGNPTANNGGWGPKIHENWFGDGGTFGSTYFDWAGVDDPANGMFSELDGGDTPLVQIVNNDGTLSGSAIVGVPIDFAQAEGDIRIGDAAMLSNGNIVVAGEDRQAGDGALFGVPNAGQLPILTVVDPDGNIVADPITPMETDSSGSIWHGIAVGDGVFGVRFSNNTDGDTIRFYDNDLNPLTDPLLLSEFSEDINGNDRGDGSGWAGNGGDLFAHVTRGSNPYVAVFNSSGEMVVDPILPDEPVEGLEDMGLGGDRSDVAIDAQGNFVVVYQDQTLNEHDGSATVAARFFNADGTPATPPFVVSEKFGLDGIFTVDRRPRVSMRDGVMAVVWQDTNFLESTIDDLVMRVFEAPFEDTSINEWNLH